MAQRISALLKEKNYAEAVVCIREAIDKCRSDPRDETGEAKWLNNLSFVYGKQKKLDEAITAAEQGLAIRRRILPAKNPLIATSLNNIAELYLALGNVHRAEVLHREGLSIRRGAYPQGHPDVACSATNLAHIYDKQGRHEEAKEYYTEAAEIYRALGKRDPTAHSAALAAACFNVAQSAMLLGQFRPAMDHLEESLAALRRKADQGDSPEVGKCLNDLSALHILYREYDKALAYREEELARLRRIPGGKQGQAYLDFLDAITVLYWKKGLTASLVATMEEMVEIKKRDGNKAEALVQDLTLLGEQLMKNKDYAKAVGAFDEVLSLQRSQGDVVKTALALSNCAGAHLEAGDLATARGKLEEGVGMLGDVGEEEAAVATRALLRGNLAVVLARAGEDEGCQSLFPSAPEQNALVDRGFAMKYIEGSVYEVGATYILTNEQHGL